ncbi:MAG: YciI family protein [Woeseia sp.]
MNAPGLRRLRDLQAQAEAPAELEERVVRALKTNGLIRTGARGDAKMNRHYAITAVIAVAALLAGFLAGQRTDGLPAATPPDDLSQFAMLLYENDSYQYPEAGRMAERIGEYSEWAREVAAAGKYVTGEKLADDGLLIAPGREPAAAIPMAAEGTIGGYFVIRAKDLDEAASIAATCPHVRYGGTVSLRRLET